MTRLTLLLLLLCATANAQQPQTVTVPVNKPIVLSAALPNISPEQQNSQKSVIRWSVDKPLDFVFIPLVDNKVLHGWAPTGNYSVVATVTTVIMDWTNKEFDLSVSDQKFFVTVGNAPTPPGPQPPIPPGPTPTEDESVNTAGPVVLILKEAENFSPTENELQILNSTRIKEYLNTKTLREPGNIVGWRQWDDDYSDSQLSGNAKFWTTAYRKALSKAGDKRPWLFISTPVKSFNYDISDKTEQQVLDIIKSHIP